MRHTNAVLGFRVSSRILVIALLAASCGDAEDGPPLAHVDPCIEGCAQPDPDPNPEPEPEPEPSILRAVRPDQLPDGFLLHELGSFATVDGETPTISIPVDAETEALFVGVVGTTGVPVGLARLSSPSAEALVSRTPETSSTADVDSYFAGFAWAALSPNKTLFRHGAALAMIPSTPDIPLEVGDYLLQAGAFNVQLSGLAGQPSLRPADGSLELFVVERRTPPAAAGLIHLALYFSGSSGLTAATAPGNAGVQTALDLIDEVYAPVGIQLGEVRYLDLAGDPSQTVRLDEPSCAFGHDLEALVAHEKEEVAGSINVFFIERFECLRFGGQLDVAANLAGVANGIPGFPLAASDGVIMATRLIEDYPDAWSLVLAHELAHFLGLFHAKEYGVDVYDNIADTPEDDRVIDNLMYGHVDTNKTLSPDQGALLRMNPWVTPAAP